MKNLPLEGPARFSKRSYEAETQAANVPICSTEASAAWLQHYSILLRHSFKKFFMRTARRAVQEHGIGFSTSGMLQRYPYKLYTQHGGAGSMVSDTNMGGVYSKKYLPFV